MDGGLGGAVTRGTLGTQRKIIMVIIMMITIHIYMYTSVAAGGF